MTSNAKTDPSRHPPTRPGQQSRRDPPQGARCARLGGGQGQCLRPWHPPRLCCTAWCRWLRPAGPE
ncbi:protein of unknown function [Cupriavidus taiwanensis]|nr:protein of unknown function [Cupriavidus taiwanensis]